MRAYKTAVAVLKVSCCAECPVHERVMRRTQIASPTVARWISEPEHTICKKTGKKVRLTHIDEDCPLPVMDVEAAVDSCLRRNDGRLEIGGSNG